MEIAGLAMGVKQGETMSKVGMAVLSKAMDTQKSMAAGEIAMMNKLPQSAGYGDRLNATA
jgi:hypothetical protein